MSDFYFHRPWWLLAIIPVLVFIWLFKDKYSIQSNWHKHIDKHLLSHVLDSISTSKKISLIKIYAISWIIAIVILSGPSWEKNPAMTFLSEAPPLFIILDLSRSMLI